MPREEQEQARRRAALRSIHAFCAQERLPLPPHLVEHREETLVRFVGHTPDGRRYSLGYERVPEETWRGIGWGRALYAPWRSAKFFRRLSDEQLADYRLYGNEGCVGVNAQRADREARKRRAKADAPAAA